MKSELADLVRVLLKRRKNPTLTIALAALFVAWALIQAINSFVDAPIQSLIFLLIAIVLILAFTAWIVVQVMSSHD